MISKYASLVKFSHTIFAMPFALIGYTYALTSNNIAFDWLLLAKIILCMVFARNAAMGFNRWADRAIDAANPRTASREIPAKVISPRAALLFVIVNSLLFVGCTLLINHLAAILSPVALFVILFYSYCKRFTSAAHLVLGLGLSIAPMGAYIAVMGEFSTTIAILSAAVLTWCAGFDIIYALQDAEYDRSHGLHSIPARFSAAGALTISALLHLLSAAAIVSVAMMLPYNIYVWIGSALFIAIIATEHLLVTPTKVRNIGIAFGTLNGLASICYAIFVIAGLIIG